MRDQFVGLLTSQVGYHEGRNPDGTWNNHQRFSAETPGLEWSQDQPWCATFEAWAAHQLGMDGMWPMTAGCLDAVDWWQRHGRWSQYPVLGGPFYLGPGGGTHTGVVVAYDADTIFTVEGNSNPGGSPNGDGVYLRQRPRRGTGGPYGYGVPAYPEGTVSADPNLGGTRTARVNPVTNNPIPSEEDDMPYSEADLTRIVSAAVASPGVRDTLSWADMYWWHATLTGQIPDGAPQAQQQMIPPLRAAFLAAVDEAVQVQLGPAVQTAVAEALASGVQLNVTATATPAKS